MIAAALIPARDEEGTVAATVAALRRVPRVARVGAGTPGLLSLSSEGVLPDATRRNPRTVSPPKR